MNGNALLDSRILVVDDEPANVRLIEKTLAQEGYRDLVGVTEPREGLHRLESDGADLVILDLNMPGIDGFEFLRAMRRLSTPYQPPVLMLTAQSDRVSRIQALQLGARDYVAKPFDRVELIARVRNLLEMHSLYMMVRSQNDFLETRVIERTRELYDTRLEVVRRLGRAAEYRDNETGFHIIRMSKFSALIGRSCGMRKEEAELLLHASPMHDIGKIGIPDRILLKPGKLDPDEWEVMKTHAAIGAEILSGHDSELMRMAREVALHHHEKWDGSGYPQGLAGEEIPLVGRVVAVADVFDALTSERPYKQAWPLQNALDHLRKLSGADFDPRVVSAFFEQLPQILNIRSQYAEPSKASLAMAS